MQPRTQIKTTTSNTWKTLPPDLDIEFKLLISSAVLLGLAGQDVEMRTVTDKGATPSWKPAIIFDLDGDLRK